MKQVVYDLLESLGHKVVLAHPLKTRMIAEARVKTDKVDAKTLAELLRGGFLPTSYVPTKEIRALRHLVRHRIALGRFRVRVKTQIKTELRRKNITEQFEKHGYRFVSGDIRSFGKGDKRSRKQDRESREGI